MQIVWAYCMYVDMKLSGFVLCLVSAVLVSAEVIDVDISLSDNSYTYTADLDSQQLEYRCVSSDSGVLTWKYIGNTYSNPLNAYTFYGVARTAGTFAVECYSGTNQLGEMQLTIKDNANFSVEYSGEREVYPASSGAMQTATIPLDTSGVVITCEISNGIINEPSNDVTTVTTDPSVTISLTSSTEGEYQCYRVISNAYIVVMTLSVEAGAAATATAATTQTSTAPSTTTTTQTTTTTTTTTTATTEGTTTSVPTTTTIRPLATIAPSPNTTTATSTTESTTRETTTTTTTPPASPNTVPTTTSHSPNTTHVPPSANMSSAVIGICVLTGIILLTGATCLLICLCLWRHYSGYKRQRYSKQRDSEARNGAPLGDINPSKQFPSHSGSCYQPLPSQPTEETPQSVALEGFKNQMEVLWSGDCKLLAAEYNSLGQSELRYPTEAARSHISDGRNRYKNIYPYDKSLVQLAPRGEGSEYINASYIPGLLVSEMFIAAQAPKKETMLEFWEMLWQKRVANVVMLTRFMEGNKKKCEPYLPERAGDTIGVGDLLISLLRVTSEYDTTRHLEIKSKRDISTVLRMRHFHFSGWPDHEAPRFPQGLLSFISRVKRERLPDRSPICVHCSAGVGRTGAFIALYNLMEEIRMCAPFSIHRVVNEMREHRPHMVQTFTQYKFIYLSCLELIHGDTAIPSNEFCYFHSSCLQDNPGILAAQLAEIDFFSEKSFSRSCSEALSPRNVSYNPDTSVLPFDDYRPMLSTPALGMGGYINASYVDGFHGFQDFIVTQHPNAFTARHIIQLIYQTECPLVVALTSPLEYALMGYEQGRIVYWPEPTTQHEFDGFVLKNVSQLHEEIMEFQLIDTSDSRQHRFHLIISLHWDSSGTATDTGSVLGIANEMISVKANFPTKPILVHCEDGAGKCGVLLAAYNALTQIAEEGQVDIFQVVKCLRYCRPRMVHSLVQFGSIHAVVHQYLTPNTYENLTPYQL